jgi:aminoglycoside/choline kinase family phosphotransferase
MMEPIYGAETTFFGLIRQYYDLHTPDCYYAAWQKDPFQFALFLEDLDLRGVEFNSAVKPLSPDEAAAGLEMLAAIHGQSFGDPRIAAAGVAAPFDNLAKMLETFYLPNIAAFFSALRSYAVPFSLRDEARFLDGIDRYVVLSHQGDCLLHGDAHIGNSYKENGRVGFLDWQCIAIGNPIHDVAYFMISALDIPDRRAAEKELLKRYLDRRATYPNAPRIQFDDVWQDYRRAAFMSFFTWLTNSDEWQTPEINMSGCARAGAAMLDLDCYGALGI